MTLLSCTMCQRLPGGVLTAQADVSQWSGPLRGGRVSVSGVLVCRVRRLGGACERMG